MIVKTDKSDIEYFWLEFGIFVKPDQSKNQRQLLLGLLNEGRRVRRLLDSFGPEKVTRSAGVRIVQGDSTFWYDFSQKKNISELW